MYICICKGITEKQVVEALSNKTNANPKEILKSLGIGSDCGTCVEDAIKNILSENNLKSQIMIEYPNKT